jgi:hypothetical protein
MNRREVWLSGALVFMVALAVRLWAASSIVFARPEDAAYYVGVARNIVDGRGLVSDAIWSFQTPPLTFPRPAFEVWLPLPSFLYAIPMLVLGPTLWAAQLASSIVGSIVAVLAWRLALDASAVTADGSLARVRWVSLGAGLTAAAFLPLVLASVEPDSTAPFAVLALGASLIMARLSRRAGGSATGYAADTHTAEEASSRSGATGDRDLLALGVLLGLAALTRNEAIWLALAWAIVAWRVAGRTSTGLTAAGPLASRGLRREWVRLVGIPGIVAVAIFAPWGIRDWLTFGTPLPGQAISNALSLQGSDIFAWQDPPTLARYLAAGPATLLQLRVTGFTHNLVDVLLLIGAPVTTIGLVALPWTLRGRRGGALRPLVVFSVITFLATTLLFPVATTWGTFLHASGAVLVLLVVSAALGLDRVLEWLRSKRSWRGNVAWLAPVLTISSAALLTATLIPAEAGGARTALAHFEALPEALADAGAPLTGIEGPVITDNPIWFAETTGHTAIALPDESASSVQDLADSFGATLLVVATDNGGRWPAAAQDPTDPASTCFTPLPMTHLGDDPTAAPDVTVYAIRCP